MKRIRQTYAYRWAVAWVIVLTAAVLAEWRYQRGKRAKNWEGI